MPSCTQAAQFWGPELGERGCCMRPAAKDRRRLPAHAAQHVSTVPKSATAHTSVMFKRQNDEKICSCDGHPHGERGAPTQRQTREQVWATSRPVPQRPASRPPAGTTHPPPASAAPEMSVRGCQQNHQHERTLTSTPRSAPQLGPALQGLHSTLLCSEPVPSTRVHLEHSLPEPPWLAQPCSHRPCPLRPPRPARPPT